MRRPVRVLAPPTAHSPHEQETMLTTIAPLLFLCCMTPAPRHTRAESPSADEWQAPRVMHARLHGTAGGSADVSDCAESVSGDWPALQAYMRGRGASIEWLPATTEWKAPDAGSAILFVQAGSCALRIGATDGEVSMGDMLLLRANQELRSESPLDLLLFTRAEELSENVPAIIKPDLDPAISDTKGGCAKETGAYRRICLTWLGKNGPYLDRHLNAHRVRIRDSFTHYHPLDGGFEELYLVQESQPGAGLMVCERLDELCSPEALEAESAAELVRHIPLETNDLVLLPRGVAHRGIGGVLAQVITVPGFLPNAELGVDAAIGAVNERFKLELPQHQGDQPFVAVQQREGRVRIEVDDELFTEYLHAELPRPCFYPVYTADGRAITRNYPLDEKEHEAKDHPHHVSLWFAHGDVNGQDFWHSKETSMQLLRIDEIYSRPGRGGFTAIHEWKGADGELVLTDTRRFSFRAQGNERWIDWELSLTAPADTPVKFGDTKEGSMALRLAATMRVDGEVATGTLLNSAGQDQGSAWGKRATWLVAGGQLEGRPAGVGIFEHPQNLRSPTWWHARKYGLLAANPFGAHDFEGQPKGSGDYELGAGETLRLRYRFVFSNVALDAARAARLAEEYAGKK